MLQIRKKWLAITAAAVIGLTSVTVQAAVEMKPFILGSTTTGAVSSQIDGVKKALTANGFTVVGEYKPYANAYVIVATDGILKNMAATTDTGGYVAPERVSITKVGDQVQISYSNPTYMAAAYHVKGDTATVKNALKSALGAVKEFGSKDGMTASDLADYHYTFGMEYFDEPYQLASYDSHAQAVAAVVKGLAAHAGGTTEVYRIDIPGGTQTVFGVAMKAGANGNKYMDDKYIMNEIDFKPLRSTAHLPYEMLVTGDNVVALHARFRIAMDFPDLSMMGSHSFMNIMPTPDAIKQALTAAAGGSDD